MTDLPPFRFDLNNGPYQTSSELNQLYAGVMPLMVVSSDALEVIGTAFAFTTAYVMTATHVVDVVRERLSEDPKCWAAVYMVAPGKGYDVPDLLGGLLPIQRFAMPASSDRGLARSDIAIAQLRLPIDTRTGLPIQPWVSPLSFLPPKMGEHVLAVGYPQWNATFRDSANVDVTPTMGKAIGIVEEVWPTGRDALLLPQPSFSVGAKYTGGMSGGPVINSQGYVCGVVSRGFDMADESMSIAYASLLAPALSLTTEWADETGVPFQCDLAELAKRRWIHTDGSENRVAVHRNEDGTVVLHMSF